MPLQPAAPFDLLAAPHFARSAALASISGLIDAMADAGNLAAVIVHFNDTYLIEERTPHVPGLARIAGTVAAIRQQVRERLGKDLTLVCHGGDYLGPSRLNRRLLGAPMVELLRHCGLTAATVGNHEFDHDPQAAWDVLRARLRESAQASGPGTPYRTVLTNLRPADPADEGLFTRFLPWPAAGPRFLLCGIAGEQTLKVAQAHGFGAVGQGEWLDALHREVEALPSALALVVLTHASRDEDVELQRTLLAEFPRHALYVLGGHDHHMQWGEPRRHGLLLKCLSNARSLGVVAVPRDGLAAVRVEAPASLVTYLSRDDEVALLQDLVRQESRPSSRYLAADRVRDAVALARATMARLQAAPDAEWGPALEPEDLAALERRIVCTITANESFLGESFAGDVCRDAYGLAASSAMEQLHAGLTMLDCAVGRAGLPIDEAAQAATRRWLAIAGAAGDAGHGSDGDDAGAAGGELMVADLDENAGPLDARDSALRAGSTDFGNFAADALRQATGADVALINAGSLRADDMLPACLTRHHLRDVLLYDGPQAAIRLRLRAGEVRRLLAHAGARGGHGAFLQVSEGCRAQVDAAAEEDELSVALVRYMLAAREDEDGFCGALATTDEGWPQVQQRLLARIEATGSLEDWICAGALHVRRSKEPRLQAQSRQTAADRHTLVFIAMVDDYRAACRQAGLRASQMHDPAADPATPRPVALALEAMLAFTLAGWRLGPGSKDEWFTALWHQLRATEANFVQAMAAGETHPVAYDAYLQQSIELLSQRLNRQIQFRLLTGRDAR